MTASPQPLTGLVRTRVAPRRPHAARAGSVADGYGSLMDVLLATSVIGLGASYSRVYLFHLVLAAVAARSLVRPTRRTAFAATPSDSRYPYFFYATVAWFAAGMLWSLDRFYTAQYLGYLSVGSMLSLAIIKYVRQDWRRLQRTLSVARAWLLVDVGVGVLEALTPFRLPISALSAYSQANSDLAESSLDTLAYLNVCPTGFHWNPNNYAVVMVILLPFTLLHRRLDVRVVGSAVLAGLIYATGSRGCLCAALLVTFLSPAFGRGAAWIVRLGLVLAVASLGLAVAPQVEAIGNKRLAEAAGTLTALGDYLFEDSSAGDSIGVRQRLIRNGLNALVESRGLGVGGGADKAVQEAHGGLVAELGSMHNVWVELLVCGGVPFFVMLVVWYGLLVYELRRLSIRLPRRSPLRYCCTAFCLAMVGFVPAAVSASSTIYMLPMYLMFGFAIALVNVCRSATKPGPRAPEPRARSGRRSLKPRPA